MRVTVRGVKVFPFTSFLAVARLCCGQKGNTCSNQCGEDSACHASDARHNKPQHRILRWLGAVMALRKHGHKDVVKLPGCELWLKIIAALAPQGKRFYLVGSKPAVIRTDCDEAEGFGLVPGVNIVGYRDGYIKTEAERKALIADVAEKRPDAVLWRWARPSRNC